MVKQVSGGFQRNCRGQVWIECYFMSCIGSIISDRYESSALARNKPQVIESARNFASGGNSQTHHGDRGLLLVLLQFLFGDCILSLDSRFISVHSDLSLTSTNRRGMG